MWSKQQAQLVESILERSAPDMLLRTLSPHPIGAQAQLKIYSHTVYTNAVNALKLIFDVTFKTIGEDCFTQLANIYIRAHPPATGAFIDYGMSFPSFLKTFKPLHTLPYLADVAHMDWFIHQSEYAKKEPTLSLQAIHKVDPEDYAHTYLRFKSSVFLFQSPYPLDRIYQLSRKADSNEQLDLSERGANVLIYRNIFKSSAQHLPSDEYAFLKRLFKHYSLLNALEATIADHPNLCLTEILLKHFKLGLFSSYYLKE